MAPTREQRIAELKAERDAILASQTEDRGIVGSIQDGVGGLYDSAVDLYGDITKEREPLAEPIRKTGLMGETVIQNPSSGSMLSNAVDSARLGLSNLTGLKVFGAKSIDPYEKQDLGRRTLRDLGEAFTEDPYQMAKGTYKTLARFPEKFSEFQRDYGSLNAIPGAGIAGPLAMAFKDQFEEDVPEELRGKVGLQTVGAVGGSLLKKSLPGKVAMSVLGAFGADQAGQLVGAVPDSPITEDLDTARSTLTKGAAVPTALKLKADSTLLTAGSAKEVFDLTGDAIRSVRSRDRLINGVLEAGTLKVRGKPMTAAEAIQSDPEIRRLFKEESSKPDVALSGQAFRGLDDALEAKRSETGSQIGSIIDNELADAGPIPIGQTGWRDLLETEAGASLSGSASSEATAARVLLPQERKFVHLLIKDSPVEGVQNIDSIYEGIETKIRNNQSLSTRDLSDLEQIRNWVDEQAITPRQMKDLSTSLANEAYRVEKEVDGASRVHFLREMDGVFRGAIEKAAGEVSPDLAARLADLNKRYSIASQLKKHTSQLANEEASKPGMQRVNSVYSGQQEVPGLLSAQTITGKRKAGLLPEATSAAHAFAQSSEGTRKARPLLDAREKLYRYGSGVLTPFVRGAEIVSEGVGSPEVGIGRLIGKKSANEFPTSTRENVVKSIIAPASVMQGNPVYSDAPSTILGPQATPTPQMQGGSGGGQSFGGGLTPEQIMAPPPGIMPDLRMPRELAEVKPENTAFMEQQLMQSGMLMPDPATGEPSPAMMLVQKLRRATEEADIEGARTALENLAVLSPALFQPGEGIDGKVTSPIYQDRIIQDRTNKVRTGEVSKASLAKQRSAFNDATNSQIIRPTPPPRKVSNDKARQETSSGRASYNY